MLSRDLVEAGRLAHRLAGQVHVGLGLHQQHRLAAQLALGRQRPEAQPVDGQALLPRQRIAGHEAGVVAGALIFEPRVAQKDHQPARSLGCKQHGKTSI